LTSVICNRGHGVIKEIQHYGIIGDLYTAALIGKDGSMDELPANANKPALLERK
jgi:hypothetical protein